MLKTLGALCLVGSNLSDIVMAKGGKEDSVKLFSVVFEDGKEINLLNTLEDIPRYFGKKGPSGTLPYPPSFSFPRSFEYSMNLGTLTNLEKRQFKVYEGSQKAVFDAFHNRVRIERESRIFHEKDTEVMIFDFEKMRLLISDPNKHLCLNFNMKDISPVSMVPKDQDQILIADAMASIWTGPEITEEESSSSKQKIDWTPPMTKYLGEYTVKTSSSQEENISTDSLHIFVNNYSFINLEEKYLSTGGSYGAHTMYLWQHIVPEVDDQSD